MGPLQADEPKPKLSAYSAAHSMPLQDTPGEQDQDAAAAAAAPWQLPPVHQPSSPADCPEDNQQSCGHASTVLEGRRLHAMPSCGTSSTEDAVAVAHSGQLQGQHLEELTSSSSRAPPGHAKGHAQHCGLFSFLAANIERWAACCGKLIVRGITEQSIDQLYSVLRGSGGKGRTGLQPAA